MQGRQGAPLLELGDDDAAEKLERVDDHLFQFLARGVLRNALGVRGALRGHAVHILKSATAAWALVSAWGAARRGEVGGATYKGVDGDGLAVPRPLVQAGAVVVDDAAKLISRVLAIAVGEAIKAPERRRGPTCAARVVSRTANGTGGRKEGHGRENG